MKKSTSIICFMFFLLNHIYAQQTDSIQVSKDNFFIKKNNISTCVYDVLGNRNLNVKYERYLIKKISTTIMAGYYLNERDDKSNNFSFEINGRYFIKNNFNGYFLYLGYRFTTYEVEQSKNILRTDSLDVNAKEWKMFNQVDMSNFVAPVKKQLIDQRITFGLGFKDYFGKKKNVLFECNYGLSLRIPEIIKPRYKQEIEIYEINNVKYINTFVREDKITWYKTNEINKLIGSGLVFKVNVGYLF